jgi:hypothetical protein
MVGPPSSQVRTWRTLLVDLDALVAKNLLTEQRESAGYYLTPLGATVNAVMAGTVEQAVSEDATPYERTSFQRIMDRVLRQLAPLVP